MYDGGSDGSVKAIPVSQNGIAGGRIGWELRGSVNRRPIGGNRVGGMLGVVMGEAVCVGVVRWEQNARQ